MTDKTEAQPEALRLAAEFEDCIRIDAIPSINDVKKSAAELRRQHAEIDRLRALAATCYAGLGGECDLPAIWLDALNDAANGDPFDTDCLLPYTSAIRAKLVAQTNRAAAAEQQVTALTQRLDMANRLNTDARNQLAQLSARHNCRLGGDWCLLSAAPPPPEREPLTEQEILEAVSSLYAHPALRSMGAADDIATARAIERAHGIGATND